MSESLEVKLPPLIISSREQKTFDTEAIMIYQRGFGILDSQATHKKIGTAGLGPCIALTGYHNENKVLFVAHFDGMTELHGSISTIATWLQNSGVKELSQISVILDGGDESSKVLRQRIKTLLDDWKMKNIKDNNPESKADVGSRKFIVSVEDGHIQYDTMPAYPEDPALRTAKLGRTQSTAETTLSPDFIDVKGQIFGIDK